MGGSVRLRRGGHRATSRPMGILSHGIIIIWCDENYRHPERLSLSTLGRYCLSATRAETLTT
ncbi:hypothetical protein FTUN_4058 [Frigoriglobus tundricola]|uniref:Uncharacterized protein n=1 Tax=Frigoriglobus tundricola TaxID=2774151 RepID=A0A6M5YT98_9BACT|nr:hypothetical protein FTUN_4058 [Frigoriglobus tundricola]